MKIALVTETYAPEINGVAMTLDQLVKSLRQRGHQVQVARPWQRADGETPKETLNQLLVSGIPIPSYPSMRIGLFCKRKLLQAWRTFKPDIIHIATEGPLGISAMRAAKNLSKPCTSSFHTNFHSYSEHYNAAFLTRMVLAYLRWIHNNTLCTMAPTQKLVDELAEEGFENTCLFGRGVDLSVFNPQARDESLRKSWGATPDSNVFIHISRLAAEKNYPLLFKAYEAINQQNPSSQFVIVGEGPVLNKYRKQYPQFHFTGPIKLDDRENCARHYASGDVFLFGSTTETYGNVITESMACGNAVVTYDYAAAHSYIEHDENGLLAPLGDEDELIRQVLELEKSKDRIRRLGNAAAESAKVFDWTPAIDAFERELIKRHQQYQDMRQSLHRPLEATS